MLNQKIVFCLAVMVLFLAALFGGGQGFFGDVLAQLAAIALLIACLLNKQSELNTASSTTRILSFSFVAIVLFVPLLQLYPWSSSTEFAMQMQRDLQEAGVQLSNGSSYKTYGAEHALFSLLPAIAIFMACLQLPSHFRLRLLIALVLIVAFNIVIGFAKLAQGYNSPLRFYAITNVSEAVGFFANRNHFASLLMMSLPLAVAATAWWVYKRKTKTAISPLLIIGGGLFCILIILAMAVARSRAGLLLGAIGVMLSLPAMFALPNRVGMKRFFGVLLVFGVIVTIQFGLLGILQRFNTGIVDNTRKEMTMTSIEAGKAFAPMGSGLGTFRQAYAPFEARHEEQIVNTLTNHAHNDYAELWLEGGYPALLAIGIFWILFIVAGYRVWRLQKQGDSFDVLLSRVAWVAVLLSLLHSYIDYPLRTTANASVFGLLLALTLVNRIPD
ncbi:MAG: O-antigen ligase family protein, partial [Arenimonas sp.]